MFNETHFNKGFKKLIFTLIYLGHKLDPIFVFNQSTIEFTNIKSSRKKNGSEFRLR